MKIRACDVLFVAKNLVKAKIILQEMFKRHSQKHAIDENSNDLSV